MPWVTIQNWTYVRADTLPGALRALAQAVEDARPTLGYTLATETNSDVVSLNYDEEDEQYIAGICTSWRTP